MMGKNEVSDKLRDIIRPYVQNQDAYSQLNESSHLLRDLRINSAHIIDIVLDAEKEFNITIDDDAVEKMGTFGDAVEAIHLRVSA